MILKITGSVLIIFGCGFCGYTIGQNDRMKAKLLKQLIHILEFMQRELQYRMTPLPVLCRQASEAGNGPVQEFFLLLSEELEKQVSASVRDCVECILRKQSADTCLPVQQLRRLGADLGKFDLYGQLQGLQSLIEECEEKWKMLTLGQESRLRNYQTLSLCAGAAIAILFI